MTPPKIHYQTQNNRLKCSYGGSSSSEISQVTCCNCLRRINNETVGRPPKKLDTKYKQSIFSLSPEAWEKVQGIPKGERSAWINRLILDNNN